MNKTVDDVTSEEAMALFTSDNGFGSRALSNAITGFVGGASKFALAVGAGKEKIISFSSPSMVNFGQLLQKGLLDYVQSREKELKEALEKQGVDCTSDHPLGGGILWR